MRRNYLILSALIFVFLSCSKEQGKNPIEYVDIFIGTGKADTESVKERPGAKEEYGQTIPAVTAPFGMTQWTPQTHASEEKCLSPFYAGTTFLQGFRATHWTSGSCVQDYGSFTCFPDFNSDNNFQVLPDQRKTLFMYDGDSCFACIFFSKLYR